MIATIISIVCGFVGGLFFSEMFRLREPTRIQWMVAGEIQFLRLMLRKGRIEWGMFKRLSCYHEDLLIPESRIRKVLGDALYNPPPHEEGVQRVN